ncbi:hypothetical protein WA556_002502 [Blastocystis sp. ATCC 50177/Nand II]
MSRRIILSSEDEDSAMSDVPAAITEKPKITTKEETSKPIPEKDAKAETAKKPQRKRATRKKEDSDEEEEEVTSKRRRTTKTQAKRNAPKRGRGSKKAAAKEESDDGEEDSLSAQAMEGSDEMEEDSVSEDDLTAFKSGQTKPTPSPGCGDRVFYESLYKQNPNSFIALKWCIEYGVFPTKICEEKFREYLLRKEKMKLEKK